MKVTRTPCKARTDRRDALPAPNALAFYAKIRPFAAGPSAGCMAQTVATHLAPTTRATGTDCARAN